MFRNGLEPWHVIIIVILVVLLFGANKLPALAKSVGQSLKIFKNEVKDLTGDDKPTNGGQADSKPDDGTGPKA